MGNMSKKTLWAQEGALKSYFPNSRILRDGESSIIWIGEVTPSALSATYTLKVECNNNKTPKVYVLNPKPLALAKGETDLPHVYSTIEQQLCLYYPKEKEWNPGMFYVHTLIPWACEWLCHYEIWVSTGTWHGGGIEHGPDSEKTETQ